MQRLTYFQSGQASDTPLLFVHGWTCDHTVMQPLIQRFEPDHVCIAPDLNGHGQSRVNDAGFSIYDQCALLETDLGETLHHMVAIGHSMGGQIALELAARGVVKAAVLLDPAPILPHEKALAWGQALKTQLAKVDIPAMMEAFARDQFQFPIDKAMEDDLVAVMKSTDPHVVRAAWDGILSFDGPGALERLPVPCLSIFANKPLNDVKAMAKASRHLTTAQTACSGHMQQLEVPDQLAAMIRRFLSVIDEHDKAAKHLDVL